MSVVFRDEDLADLDEISRYISQSDPRWADRVIQRIYNAIFGVLDVLPLAGREDGTRKFAVPGLPYIIVYVPLADVIDIVAIFHTSRDPAAKRRP